MKISLTGVNEIDKVLKGLPKQIQHRVMVSAHRYAAQPFVKLVQATAPISSAKKRTPNGRIKANVGTTASSVKKASVIGETFAGVKSKAFYARFIELGTDKRETKGRGKYRRGSNRGQITAKPFIEPAFNQTKTQIIDRIAEGVGKRLLSFMERTIKKGKS